MIEQLLKLFMENSKKGMALKQLNELLKKWQKKLLLNRWKLSLKLVDFTRKDFRQSGDIKIDLAKKTAVVFMAQEPFRNEEEVLIHELMHLVLWDLDIFSEKIILKTSKPLKGNHGKYMDKLEKLAEHLTKIVIRQ